MDELLPLLCGLTILLLIVMVVGHGLWVVAKWILTGGSGANETGTRCSRCGATFGVRQGRCVVCGAAPNVAPANASLNDELKTTLRQLSRLLDRGTISQDQFSALRKVIEAELEPAPSPATPIPPPIVAVSAPAEAIAIQPAASTVLAEAVEAIVVEPAAPPVHPLDRPEPPPAPKSPVAPGRTLADMLQSFMEESNIRWGEILAAMLIVLCSVGLVISLRNTLKNVPYFPAILFTLFTVSFHGAGLYTLRRWNLQTVSRVILIISLLLVPLTFGAAIVLSGSGDTQRPPTDPLFLVIVLSGVGIFSWLTYSASRELLGRGAWPFAAGVLGCSVSQILIHRAELTGVGFWRLNAVAAVPLVSFLLATVWQLLRSRQLKQLSERRIKQILLVLGVATFAFLAPLILLLLRSEPHGLAVARLAPQLSLAAATVLALGLVIHRRTTARRLAAWQTAGTAIFVFGGILLVALVAAAWPEPELLLAVGAINAVVLIAMALVSDLPLLYVPAVACSALALVIGMHLAGGYFADRERLSLKIIQAGLMGRSAVALSLLAGVIAGIGGWFFSRGKNNDAQMLWISTAGLAALAMGIASFSGFIPLENWPQDRDLSAAILLFYGGLLIALGPATGWQAFNLLGLIGETGKSDSGEFVKREEERWGAVIGFGSVLLWTAAVQALQFNATVRGWLTALHWLPEQPILVATISQGAIMALLAAAVTGRGVFARATDFVAVQQSHRWRFLAQPLAVCAAIWLTFATPFVIAVREGQFNAHAVMALCAAAAWALVALSQRWQLAVSAVQFMAALAPAFLIAGIWNQQHDAPNWALHNEHLFVQMAALAVGAIIWSAARRLSSGREVLGNLFNAPWPAVDQVLLGLAAIGLPLVTILMVLPQIGLELNFDPYLRGSPVAAAGESVAGLRYGWIALALVLAALLVSLWERVSVAATVGLGLATFAAVSLAAGHFETSVAVASASRWFSAIYALIWGAAYIARDPLRATFKRLPGLRWDRFPRGAPIWFCAQPLLLGGRAILLLTVIAVCQNASGIALKGPAANSIFTAMGPTISYAAPLMALVVVLLGYAIRDRQAGFAAGGAAVSQFAVNLAFLLYVSTAPAQPTSVRTVEWLQWNSIAAGAYALVWMALARWITPATADANARKIADALWSMLVAIGGATAGALVVWAAWIIVDQPGAPAAEIALLGGWLSYLALVLVLAAVVWRAARWLDTASLGDAAFWLFAGLVVLTAATLNRFDSGGQWIACHALEGGWVILSALACALICWFAASPSVVQSSSASSRLARLVPSHISVAFVTALVVLLAIRGNFSDPGQPWWSLAGTIASCAIVTALGLARRSQPYAYASTFLAGLAIILFWVAPTVRPWVALVSRGTDFVRLSGLEFAVVAVIATAAFWLWQEINAQRRLDQSWDSTSVLPRIHVVVACLLVPLHFLVRLVIALGYPGQNPLSGFDVSLILATLALGSLLLLALWDRRALWDLPLAYLWGGAAWCLAIGLAGVWLQGPTTRLVAIVLATAAHLALTGQIWSYGANLAAWGKRVGIPDPIGGLTRTANWLPIINLLLVFIVCLVDLLLVLTLSERWLRVASAWGPAIAAWGVLCLAQDRRRDALQLASLLIAGLTAIYLGWAQLDPGQEAALWLQRVFRLLMVLAALTFVYGLALPRFLLTRGSWNTATRKAGYLAGSAALATFVLTLALEIALFQPGVGAPVDDLQVAAIAVVLLGLIAGLISMALLPGRDPLLLSERGRQAYVYAAQATAGLLFAHLYVCKPLWFDGVLRPYWPFIVMALAFVGVGAAELFHRMRIPVLAEPLQRTGALLPLLPVLGMWVITAQADYALVLLVVGMLYLALSFTRKSWASMVAAAVAGNGALWTFMFHQQFFFAANPQLWLIPPALSVLIAAQVNRHRLTPQSLAAIRYAAAIVIYVSSTSEIFIRGIGTSLAPPMILMALAVAGALAGIALRVRAFLFLGMSFTLLALVSIVAHAARAIDEIWPWFAFGIGLGVAVLVLLGIFEKKRTEVMLLIARLRQWEH